MERNKDLRAVLPARLLAGLLALLVWQLAAWAVHNRLLLVGPVQTLQRLCTLLPRRDYWQAIGFTLSRVALGFFLGFSAALLLAVLSARFPAAEVLLQPYMAAVKAVPAASFVVMALLWLSARRLSCLIAFLMALPILYSTFLQGIRAADVRLLEMARVFRMGIRSRIRCVYAPALRPYCLSACRSALGLCWKAGVAAEVIGVCTRSMGGMLYDAKVYLELDSLFAWTLTVVLVSMGFEACVLRLLRLAFTAVEGCAWTSL